MKITFGFPDPLRIGIQSGIIYDIDADHKIPCILEPELTDKAFRKNWARFKQEIYEVIKVIEHNRKFDLTLISKRKFLSFNFLVATYLDIVRSMLPMARRFQMAVSKILHPGFTV